MHTECDIHLPFKKHMFTLFSCSDSFTQQHGTKIVVLLVTVAVLRITLQELDARKNHMIWDLVLRVSFVLFVFECTQCTRPARPTRLPRAAISTSGSSL